MLFISLCLNIWKRIWFVNWQMKMTRLTHTGHTWSLFSDFFMAKSGTITKQGSTPARERFGNFCVLYRRWTKRSCWSAFNQGSLLVWRRKQLETCCSLLYWVLGPVSQAKMAGSKFHLVPNSAEPLWRIPGWAVWYLHRWVPVISSSSPAGLQTFSQMSFQFRLVSHGGVVGRCPVSGSSAIPRTWAGRSAGSRTGTTQGSVKFPAFLT